MNQTLVYFVFEREGIKAIFMFRVKIAVIVYFVFRDTKDNMNSKLFSSLTL